MTWQVPGAKIEIAEHLAADSSPLYAVNLEIGIDPRYTRAVMLEPDTATALAAALIDAAHRCEERRKYAERRRVWTKAAQAPSHPEYIRAVAEGYAADIEGY